MRVAHQGANTVDNRVMPDICLQHMCAIMLIDGKVTFASSHDEKRMRDRKVLALRNRIELQRFDQRVSRRAGVGGDAEPARHRRDYSARWSRI